MNKRKKPPVREMIPNMLWKSDNSDKMNRVKIIIGKSVIIGARATLIPDLISCCSVSVMTSVKRGPGAKPADKPKRIPAFKFGKKSETVEIYCIKPYRAGFYYYSPVD